MAPHTPQQCSSRPGEAVALLDIGRMMLVAASGTVQVDTPEVRVTEWRLPPGSAIGHHRHQHDYVVVPVTDGQLSVISSDGAAASPITAGQAYFRKAGVEHDVQNQTAREIVFVEIEIKA